MLRGHVHGFDWNFYLKPAWVVRSLELARNLDQLLRVVGLVALAEAIVLLGFAVVAEFVSYGMLDGVDRRWRHWWWLFLLWAFLCAMCINSSRLD